MKVTKRNGTLQEYDIEKMHREVAWACEGLKVSPSEIELKSQIQMYEGIPTADIHEVMVKSAADLISAREPDYAAVAGRLNIHGIRKEAYGDFRVPRLYDHVVKMVARGLYTAELLEFYSEAEFDALDSYIVHERDMDYQYAATCQLRDKYLVRDRSDESGRVLESPQIMNMLISAMLFASEEKGRLWLVEELYSALSTFEISLPTPIMAGLRTPTKQFSSCVLIESGDSLDSINASAAAIIKYISKRAGIGINGGAIRALGSKIANGEVMHTGVIPFWKHFQTAVKSCSQGGIRSGAATMFYPVWHRELPQLLVLKNNAGTEETRIRHLDYGVQLSGYFLDRFKKGQNVSLFSPDVCGGNLYRLFFENQEKFAVLYEQLEQDASVPRETISAVEMMSTLAQERIKTGRIYLHFVDNTIKGTPFNPELAPVRQSNLCVSGDTQILTSLGHKTISSLAGKQVDVWNGSEFSTVTVEKTGENQELVEVELSDGKSLKCTPYHKWYVVTGARNGGEKEVRAHELKAGDRLIKWNTPVIEGTLNLSNAYTNGFYTGDGCKVKTRNRVYLYGDKQNLIDEITGNVVKTYVQPAQDRTYVELIGLENKFFVPNAAYTVEARLNWLAGYLDADGCVYRNQGNEQLTCASTEFDFLVELQLMLQTLGVQSKIVDGQDAGLRWMPANDGSGENKLYQCNQAWRLLINSGDTLHLQNLGLPVKRLKLHAHQPQRNAAHFVRVVSVTPLQDREDTYCFNEPKRHKGVFNGLLTGQCLEIALPTKPLNSVDDPEGEIALCTLAALNMGKVEVSRIPHLMKLLVRALDNLLSYQDYLLPAAKNSTEQFRPLGIGVIGYAHWLAKQNAKYGEKLDETRQYVEAMQYYGLLTSTELAKERGECKGFHRTKYFNGWLKADAVGPENWNHDWEVIRKEMVKYGVRNATILAFMPSETSSQISNETNGIEPIRDLVTVKKSKSGVMKQVVPDIRSIGHQYQTAWEMIDNLGYLNAVAEINKFCCQAISVNTYYDPSRFSQGRLPVQQVLKDTIKAHKLGLTTMYYHNTHDGQSEEQTDDCAGGACKI